MSLLKVSLWRVLLFISFTLHANGQIIFQETLTGSELYARSGSGVTFTSGVGVLEDGSSLDFNPSDDNQILFTWEILPSSERGGVTVTTTISYTPETSDNDPIFLLSDGTNAVGLVRLDSGVVHAQDYLVSGTSLNGSNQTSNVITGLGSVDTFSFELRLEDESAGSSLLDFTEDVFSTPDPTSIAYARTIDTDQALYFIMASSSVAANELYQLDSIGVAVSTIPEPSFYTAIFSALILGGILVQRRRRE